MSVIIVKRISNTTHSSHASCRNTNVLKSINIRIKNNIMHSEVIFPTFHHASSIIFCIPSVQVHGDSHSRVNCKKSGKRKQQAWRELYACMNAQLIRFLRQKFMQQIPNNIDDFEKVYCQTYVRYLLQILYKISHIQIWSSYFCVSKKRVNTVHCTVTMFFQLSFGRVDHHKTAK